MSGRQSKSQYAAQNDIKKSSVATTKDGSGVTRGGYYVPGVGYFDTEPLVTTDENGQRVVQGAGLVKTGTIGYDGRIRGGKLSSAYDYARDDTKRAIERWHASRGDDDEREVAMRHLYDAYRARGEYTGSYEDFKLWWANKHSAMTGGALKWNGGFTGIPTAVADGQPLRGAPERTGGGTSTAGLYQKAGNPYRNFRLKW